MVEFIGDLLIDSNSVKNVILVMFITTMIYGIVFFYLMNNYVKMDNGFISKRLLNKLAGMNITIDKLLEDKVYLDTINTSLNTVINYKSNKYNKTDIVTISLDKFNYTVSIISSNCNTTYPLEYITRSELLYVENELLKRIPEGKR